MFNNMQSLLDVQKSFYKNCNGPPMFPHGDDPKAIQPPRPKRRPWRTVAPPPTVALPRDDLPASDLPQGFPPELAFRALAAYSLLRTLSIQLRLSPFTPNVFLRALQLPVPNRLLGRIHVALLRLLFKQLQMGYHFGGGNAKTDRNYGAVKKRKVDGIKWPLRAGDNLELLDAYTWPVFYDDYCHLTADVLWESIHGTKTFMSLDKLDTTSVNPQAQFLYLNDEPSVSSNDDKDEAIDVARSKRDVPTRSSPQTIIIEDGESALNRRAEESDDDEFVVAQEEDDDDYDIAEKRKRKRQKTSSQQSTPTPSTFQSNNAHSATSVTQPQPGLELQMSFCYESQKSMQDFNVHHLETVVAEPCFSDEPNGQLDVLSLTGSYMVKRDFSECGTRNLQSDSINVTLANAVDNAPISSLNFLESFIRGHPSEDEASCVPDKSKFEADAYRLGYADGANRDHWCHFNAVQTMRKGVPYHRLPLEEKLTALEYLLDEVACLESVAVEFEMRHRATDRFPVPYGSAPSIIELDNLVNADECAVCDIEGDLLCCDGCVLAFHRECIDLTKHQPLPEGKWLCPECMLVDPAKFGPLQHGRKCALDWFSEDDLRHASFLDFSSTEADRVVVLAEPRLERILPYPHKESKSKDGPQFLCVHGFVFQRPGLESSKPDVPLQSIELKELMNAWGSGTCGWWPLSHIPMKISPYFERLETFDPAFYISKYRNAPPFWHKRKVYEPHAVDFETLCAPPVTQTLSNLLSDRMHQGGMLARSLLSDASIFDP
jgi:hypothetical protein